MEFLSETIGIDVKTRDRTKGSREASPDAKYPFTDMEKL